MRAEKKTRNIATVTEPAEREREREQKKSTILILVVFIQIKEILDVNSIVKQILLLTRQTNRYKKKKQAQEKNVIHANDFEMS